MAQETMHIPTVRMFLTHTGFVALECDELTATDEVKLFGDHGRMAPRRISDLVAEMLTTLAEAPDDEDAAGLRLAAEDLKSSLTQVESMISRLTANRL